MKMYEVIASFDAESNSRDVRCRSDIDKQPGFQRVGFGLIRHTLLTDRTKTRMFYVLYRGPERDAKRFAEMVKLGYDGLGVDRSILSQIED
jgi:hypothetical protein